MTKQTTDVPVAESDEAVADDDLQIEVVETVTFPPREQAGEFTLRFSPYAWAKIRWIRDYCNSEIAGFGISSVEDPFYMEDFRTVKQTASSAHFKFDDDALNDYMAAMFEEGKQPSECMRLWVHTHPTKNFASPSSVDEETFTAAFGSADWAMMIIVDEGDNVYARLRIKSGNSRLQMPVADTIDYQPPLKGVDEAAAAAWKQEVDENITQEQAAPFTIVEGGVATLPECRGGRRHHSYLLAPHGGSDLDSMELSAGSDTPGSEWENVEVLLTAEEQVIEISRATRSDDILVLLNGMWLAYDIDVPMKCKAGDLISAATDIADVPPLRCGELTWKLDKGTGVEVPTYESEVRDGFVHYFDLGDDNSNDAAAIHAAVQSALADECADDLQIESLGEVRVGPSGP